jgi:hypothetical protein
VRAGRKATGLRNCDLLMIKIAGLPETNISKGFFYEEIKANSDVCIDTYLWV